MMKEHVQRYISNLSRALQSDAMDQVPVLIETWLEAWKMGRCIYLCGNGGSAGNAIHLANDLIYGAGKKQGIGLRVEALCANPAVLTCLGNDIGYDKIFSEQLRVKANPGDVLVVLSGSGNSPNMIKALEMGNQLDMKTFAILGFDGGVCKKIAQNTIHFDMNDMQIAEDLQLVIGHMCMQWLCEKGLS